MTRFATGNLRFMAPAPILTHRASFFLVALVLAAGSAHAADAAPAKAASAPRTPLLTPAQTRDCFNQKERLHAQVDDAFKDKAPIESMKAEITSTGTSLAEQVATLDKTSAEAVDAYNAKVQARDKLIDDYQSKVAAYNVKAEAVQTTKDNYEKSCELRRYDERELNSSTKRKK